MRIIAQFSKEEAIRFISHLDLLRTIQRCFRRANIPIAFSQGFNPHPILSFASALSVGLTSQAEYFDVLLDKDIDPRMFVKDMNRFLPNGITILDAMIIPLSYPAPMSIIQKAEYSVELIGLQEQVEITDYIYKLINRDEIIIERENKKGKQFMDIKPYIDKLYALSLLSDKITLIMLVTSNSTITVKPEYVIKSLCREASINIDNIQIQYHRLGLFINKENVLVSPMKYYDMQENGESI